MEHLNLLERIERTLIDGLPGQHQHEPRLEELDSSFFEREEDSRTDRPSITKIYLKKQRAADLEKICVRLFDATNTATGHFGRLDEIFAELLTFHVHLRDEQMVRHVAQTAEEFLGRFPEQPLGLPNTEDLPKPYRSYEPLVAGAGTITWPCLEVTSHFSTNVLKVVLFRVIYGTAGTNGAEEKNLVDLTADLLNTCCKLESKCQLEDDSTRHRWLVIRAFLWASWQRFQTLYFYRTLYYSRAHGEDTELGSLTVLRSTLIAPDMTIQKFSDEVAFTGKPDYMCSWAFNLLRTDGIAIGSDFRHFHQRYNQLHGDLKGRCNTANTVSCDGKQLGNCERHALEPEDQSLHEKHCTKDCPRMKWDQASYCSIKGGRAVDIEATDYDNSLLKYKNASDSTMAISHAWAHGQGGRPDTGLNQCLHILYSRLAKHLGCDSYFLDTVCIPEDHQLRAEAIKHINGTFSQSKVTLVVEKDLLNVDVSEQYVELLECILATILVSDWNVRGWTLLEAMKGRRNVHLLCQDEKTVNYSEMIEKILSEGRLDIAIFALLAPHLLSWSNERNDSEHRVGLSNPGIEEAGTLLSYRPESRLGDDIVIWSLMINQVNDLAQNAEELWRTQIGKTVKTGFLVSSAKRLDKTNFQWAPATPYAAPKDHSLPSEKSKSRSVRWFYRAFPGEETEDAEIHDSGIFATWFVHEFDARFSSTLLRTVSRRLCCWRDRDAGDEAQDQLADIILHFLKGYRYGALLQPKVAGKHEMWKMHSHITGYTGGADGTLLVVVGSKMSDFTRHHDHTGSQNRKWVWRGVWEWPSRIPLPKFVQDSIWIV